VKKTEMHNQLERIEKLASGSRLKRFLHSPAKYIKGVFIHRLKFPLLKRGSLVMGKTFWGKELQLLLPAGLDIYLTGAKTHSSEIRLAKWLINVLKEGDHFLDVGAHFGYFSLLAWQLVGSGGRVVAVEAAVGTHGILFNNTAFADGLEALHLALAAENGTLSFYEFPVLYSEYNTLNAEMYADEHWYKKINVQKVEVKSMTGDELITKLDFSPKIIKIDVEGAELEVIIGLKQYLTENTPYVVMEFSNSGRGNKPHLKAEELLRCMGYIPKSILPDGSTKPLQEPTTQFVDRMTSDSDNIVYEKSNRV